MTPPEADLRLLEALASLNQIGNTINRLTPGDVHAGEAPLQPIVEASIRVIPGSSAVIYTYDPQAARFEPQSRVSAGAINRYTQVLGRPLEDFPRPNGLGARAIQQRRTVISYEEPDIEVHPLYAKIGIQAAACSPLVIASQVVGVLYIYLHRKREFTRLELLMLANFVNQAAMSIYHTRRLESLSRNLATKEEALRTAEEQRAQAETFAAVGDIAANLLHHINNKVGIIPVRIQTIQEKSHILLQNDPYLAANLTEIERSALEALQAVRDNLAHLRPARLEPVSVAQALQNAIQAARLPAGVSLRLDPTLTSLPPVLAAAPSLAFVFTNLLENASEAMRGGGQIHIQATTSPEWVEITLSDSGPGIPPDLRERIFELNYTTRRPGKLGFGLWWVKTLMARLNGSVTLLNQPGGAAFCLRLPRAQG